jgi:hypothetical protein
MVNSLYIGAAGSVSLDFRDAGKITTIVLVTNDGATGAIEVSFNATAAFTTHDTTGVVGGLILGGGGNGQRLVFPLNESVDVGERLFLHVSGALNTARAFVHTDSAAVRASARRR